MGNKGSRDHRTGVITFAIRANGSKVTKEMPINPKQDLIPVCPNCHAMIHSKKPPFSTEEIQNFRKMKAGY